MSRAGSTSRAQQTHGEERPPLVQTLLGLELGETNQCPRASWDLLPENGLRALFHTPGMSSTTPAASTCAAVPFKSPCQLLVSSRAELSVSQRRQQPDGFGTTILWSHWCLSVLWKSLPQVSGRTRGLGLLCGCTVTHPTPVPGGEGLLCLHCGVWLPVPHNSHKTQTQGKWHSLSSLPPCCVISNPAPFNSPFPLAEFGAVPRPRLQAQPPPCPH